jgi:predicted amidohydrolase
MKLCLAQTKPFPGNIEQNIRRHLVFVEEAKKLLADMVVFPELSLTGYEPTLAGELSLSPDDHRLDVFQQISDADNITIGIGAPVNAPDGINIGLLLFQPHQKVERYAKQYLHADEEPFFASGKNTICLLPGKIAPAICYELSVPAHAENAFQQGAEFYLASVAKSAAGINEAAKRLSQIAQDYAMTVLLVNCIGLNDGVLCVGQSAIWNNGGSLLARLDDGREGLLLFDTVTGDTSSHYF